MRMMIGYLAGAGGLLAINQFAQVSPVQSVDAGSLIDQELQAAAVDPLVAEVGRMAQEQLASGVGSSTVVLVVAFVPIIFHLTKAGMAMLALEHELSVAKRRKLAGLDAAGTVD
jgi:hypothetical protein